MKRSSIATTLLAAGAGCLAAGAAWAQGTDTAAASAGSNASAPTDAADAGQLQEVVVTAERRAVDVQQTPIAVTAVSGEQLQQLHLNTISDLQSTVPSFQANDQNGFFDSINIRGMGNSALNPAIATGVAVFRDGLLMSETIGQGEAMFDIADTEVLEGPQGTFVGASSTAGAVEINSANPDFKGFGGYALAGLGSYTDLHWQGAVNLPVSDTFAVRFAFNDEERGSFSKNIGSNLNGYYYHSYGPTYGSPVPLLQGTPGVGFVMTDPGHVDSRQARVKALWRPTDNFQALVLAEYSLDVTGGEPAQPNPLTFPTLFSTNTVNPFTGSAGCSGTGPISPSQETCGPGVAQHSTYWYPGEIPRVLDYYGTAQQEDNIQSRFSVELRYTLPDGIVLRSQSGFVHIGFNHQDNLSFGPENAGWQYHEAPNDDYMSEEFNIISPTVGKFNWLAGGYWNYRDTRATINQLATPAPYQPGALPSTELFLVIPSVNRIAAAFGQVNWHFTDTLELQVGARENWDANFATQDVGVAPAGATLSTPNGTGLYLLHYNTGSTTPSGYTVLAPLNSSNRPYKDTVPTGKVDLNWTPTPGQNFYAFYARGYKSGGVNGSSNDHPTFNPEHVNDWELGWKGRLLDGHMLTQVGGYYINYQNMQYQLFDTVQQNDAQTGNYIANLAASKIYGVEVSEQSRFGGLGVNLGLSYNHSALGAVSTVPNYAFPAGFNTQNNVPQCLPGHTYSGQCFDYTPYQVNVSGEENPFSPRVTANISADYLFHLGTGTLDPRVTYSHTDQQYASIFQVPYNLMQARNLIDASVDWVVNKWDLQLYGTNLTNQLYIIGGGNPIYYGPPRQSGVQATYHF